MKIRTSATGVCGMVLLAAVPSAQDNPAPAPFEAPKADSVLQTTHAYLAEDRAGPR